MAKADLAQNLGTIARSGTLAFARSLAEAQAADRPSLIGQFGVGFYSAFMVADRVEVTSRRAGADEAWTWASEGQGDYTLAPATRAEAGTDVVLHLKADAEEFLEPFRLQAVVRKWADHITVPIAIARDGKDEPANEGTALWRKPKPRSAGKATRSSTATSATSSTSPGRRCTGARGRAGLRGAAVRPRQQALPGGRGRAREPGAPARAAHVHHRRGRLLPPWLRFVAGVVDTEDLPLNVSRETLQSTPALARIRRAVTGRVLSELKARSKDPEDYAKFWENFGPVLKEGVWEDAEHRKDVAALLRFRSSAVEGWTSLADYVARMKPGQEAIYVLVGDDPEMLARSPQLEGFRARGVEVLLLADQIDAFWPERLGSFEGKPIRSVTQGAVDLSKLAGGAEPGRRGRRPVPARAAAQGRAQGARLRGARHRPAGGQRRGARRPGTRAPTCSCSACCAGPAELRRRAARAGGQPAPPAAPQLAARAGADGDLAEAAGPCSTSPAFRTADSPPRPGRLRPACRAGRSPAPLPDPGVWWASACEAEARVRVLLTHGDGRSAEPSAPKTER
jgi:molecular chaperone HtpG